MPLSSQIVAALALGQALAATAHSPCEPDAIRAQADAFVAKMSRDGGKTVTREAFVEASKAENPQLGDQAAQFAEAAFDRMDANHDGAITRSEAARFIAEQCAPQLR